MKNGKRIAIGARPPANPHADAWVRQGDGADIGKTDLYTARLTLDVTPALRARIKVEAFTRGLTVAEMLLTRVLLAALRDLHTGGCVLPCVRWESNDYGTTRWHLMVLHACMPLDAVHCVGLAALSAAS